MSAPAGNKFWLARSRHGIKPKFPEGPEGAQMLYEACCDYFEWCEANPLYEAKLVSFEGVSSLEDIPKCRAFTVGSLCLFIDILPQTWSKWRSERQDLSSVIGWADETIRQQKFGAAAAGLLNPTIIARDLGLADKQEHTGPGGGPMQTVTTEMTPAEAAEAYARTRDER